MIQARGKTFSPTWVASVLLNYVSNQASGFLTGRVKKAEADHYGSDCPMAGHHIAHGMDDGSQTEHPMSLLRKAYGI